MGQESETRRELPDGGLVEITTVGRRSGKPRRIEIALHQIDGRLYISGMPRRERRSWLANLEAQPRFTLHVRSPRPADLPATARIIDDPDERQAVLGHVARTWGRDDLDEMVRYSPLIEVTLDQGAHRREVA